LVSADNSGAEDCGTVTTTPANKGLIVRDIRVTTFQGDTKDYVIFIVGANCFGSRIGHHGGDADSNIDLPIDPGFSVPATPRSPIWCTTSPGRSRPASRWTATTCRRAM
jgi:hypothetical protein